LDNVLNVVVVVVVVLGVVIHNGWVTVECNRVCACTIDIFDVVLIAIIACNERCIQYVLQVCMR
jgi:hypothetical protein